MHDAVTISPVWRAGYRNLLIRTRAFRTCHYLYPVASLSGFFRRLSIAIRTAFTVQRSFATMI
ncbi:hypothetical protein SERLADRAFT_476209 [Serpula lacrymans var. lacrymans S7.9]|uniref:Uncharacterized protein n=1 Tax=Serpula lacrymans var. lacrymans (strain S7.9) TaxID=578457 RepID=F8P744_SERL9|nr:uncharacterized protein SERLADRAFT_476209 [Serpula lacrymans var. lacrymans S7.9]EGO21260.1 hypothetical protein SERLADRAFT_476209 [Serpula lacrymans var. lacrymans S7.9]